MEFQYKIQEYQTDAVQAVVDVFAGQELAANVYGEEYIHDVGKWTEDKTGQGTLYTDREIARASISDRGVRNLPIILKDKVILQDESSILGNILKVQRKNHIPETLDLVKEAGKSKKKVQLGRVLLDVEMETGTGKTYVYIKTMYELNKHYGWKKFIIVVPSVAIREGVKKSFDTMEQHFFEQYGKKVRCFIYNSDNLNQLDNFATDAGINVMIINMQAFSSSFAGEEKAASGKSKALKKIYSKPDWFGSRRPIDVVAEVNPIVIMDEPQKMGGDATLTALKEFNPLFVLNYSATHKEHHNPVYILDALDAYKKQLVKRIEVKGIEAKHTTAQGSYVYLEKIVKSSNKAPMAKLRLEVKHGAKHKREAHNFNVGDALGDTANGLAEYANCRIEDIDAVRETVTISGINVTLRVGQSYGDMQEMDIRRIQIHETIASHFAKEHDLFQLGIKCLSLFFIDEVAKYRQYDDEGREKNGVYAEIFEEEYNDVWNEYRTLFKDENKYQEYLQTICSDPHIAHRGYFSIDKKTGRSIDSDSKGKDKESVDISAYDLILKNKERLLSFDEPTRFIFSHSALREGWDNPNIFQICTLKESDNVTSKRQEVGRGMRLCVDKSGKRMDKSVVAGDVHNINLLTVIASESYNSYVDGLQKDIKESLYERPKKATPEELKKLVKKAKGVEISDDEALELYDYLRDNGYIDKDKKITGKCREDLQKKTLADLPESIAPLKEEVEKVLECFYDEQALNDMLKRQSGSVVRENQIKEENFNKKQFQELWKRINHKYAYTVEFDSAELVDNSIKAINKDLVISKPIYEVVTMRQGKDMLIKEEETYQYGNGVCQKKVLDGDRLLACRVPYDLVGRVAKNAMLTRKTAAAILKGMSPQKFIQYKYNPEEFITKVANIIVEQKATIIVEHIEYHVTDEAPFPSPDIFTMKKSEVDFANAIETKKHILDYVFTDGSSENSVEKNFVRKLEAADEVVVYAKLPRTFSIPTPVGKYSPDWAIAFKEGTVKHIYFVAETKGSMDKMELRPIERAKTECAEKLFNKFNCADKVRYHVVTTYDDLMNVMNEIKE